ncbi:MAG: amidohydrolase family protein [Actinomycetota bacterium]|nr:amidohydrolase family protein [Actinomycetota bacterium]
MLLAAKWVLPITSDPIENGAILISKDKIKAVGRKRDLIKTHPKETVIDFGKAILLPGFVDTHTHLEYSVFRGMCDDLPFALWKIQVTKKSKKLSDSDWISSAQLGTLEAIQSGITCIADISSTGASLSTALLAGLRGAIFCEVSGMDHSKIDEVVSCARRNVHSWLEQSQNSHLKIGVSPLGVYTVAPPLFKAVSDWARKEDIPLCLHLAGSPDEYSFIMYGSSLLATTYRDLMGWSDLLWQPMGVSPVKYVEQWDVFEGEVIAVHCIQVGERDIDILRKYDVAIAHCPKCSAKLGMGIAPLRDFIRCGLRVGIGTDSPASNNTMDIFDEMRTGLLLQRGASESVEGFSAEQFVRMATLGGAEVLKMEGEIGSLEEGKQADIIAVDISHSHQIPVNDPYSALVYTTNQENVIFTMVGGKVLYEKNGYSILDQEEILACTEPIRKKLKGRSLESRGYGKHAGSGHGSRGKR